MKTFREFLQIREGGLWANPAPIDGKGTKRPPQKTDSSRYDGSSAAGINTAQPQPQAQQQVPPKKTMKKK